MKEFFIIIASLIIIASGTVCPIKTQPVIQEETVAEITVSATNALKKAKQYLRVMPFSYKGLIEQLEYDGFSYEDSVYAADNCEADWNEQAVKKAKTYLNIMAFSKTGLIDQLEYDGFTTEQATYAAEQNGFE